MPENAEEWCGFLIVAVMMKVVYLQQMLESTHIVAMLKTNSMISNFDGKCKMLQRTSTGPVVSH